MQSNGQQRPSNPFRFAVWRSKPFPDGRPPTAEFSLNVFIPLDVLRQIYDAIANGTIQPEQDRNGTPGVTCWGSGYRGTGAPTQSGGTSPVMSGNFQLPKAIWQAQQAAQQQQVAPAYVAAFPPPQGQLTDNPQGLATSRAPAAAPAQPAPWVAPELPQQQQPVPQAAPAPAQQGWGQPAQGGWATAPDL
jgi:hypothetical protein